MVLKHNIQCTPKGNTVYLLRHMACLCWSSSWKVRGTLGSLDVRVCGGRESWGDRSAISSLIRGGAVGLPGAENQ